MFALSVLATLGHLSQRERQGTGVTDSHASDIGHWLGMTTQKAGAGNGSDIGHWLGMTLLRGVRGDAPQGYLLRCVGIALPTKRQGVRT